MLPVLNLGGPIHISGMAEARIVKFCAYTDYIVLPKGRQVNPWKGRGLAHMTHFYMHNCWLGKTSPWHTVEWDQQCHWWQSTVSRILDVRCYTRLKAPSVRFVTVFVANLVV